MRIWVRGFCSTLVVALGVAVLVDVAGFLLQVRLNALWEQSFYGQISFGTTTLLVNALAGGLFSLYAVVAGIRYWGERPQSLIQLLLAVTFLSMLGLIPEIYIGLMLVLILAMGDFVVQVVLRILDALDDDE